MELMRMDCPDCRRHNTLVLKADDENLYDTVWECEVCDFVPVIEFKFCVCVGADGAKELYDKLDPIFQETWKKMEDTGIKPGYIHLGPEEAYFSSANFPKIDSYKLVTEKLKTMKKEE